MEISKDNLNAIAFIFERANGNTLGEYEVGVIEESGLSNVSVETLENSIIENLNKNQIIENSFKALAYWVLSKRFNKKLIPEFTKWLKNEVSNEEPEAIYQLLIALENLEQPAFGKDRNGSFSIEDVELNIRDANEYLEKNA
jgi:uncharacterized membrane-anchored protein YjiN (DUF445 family)